MRVLPFRNLFNTASALINRTSVQCFFLNPSFAIGTLKAMQPSTASVDSAKYGKVPRSVGVAKNVSSEHFVEHNKKRRVKGK